MICALLVFCAAVFLVFALAAALLAGERDSVLYGRIGAAFGVGALLLAGAAGSLL